MTVCSSFWSEQSLIIHHLLTNQGSKGNVQRKRHMWYHHLDLPLQGDYENIMDIGKEHKSKGFPAHLFPFIIVISLSKNGVIKVGSK